MCNLAYHAEDKRYNSIRKIAELSVDKPSVSVEGTMTVVEADAPQNVQPAVRSNVQSASDNISIFSVQF